MEIRQALAAACSALGLERLDAQLLLLHALGRPQDDRAWLLAHDTDVLDPDTEMRYIQLTRRRAAGMPLAYLTGRREFYGLELLLDPRVLDPRPDTETLVDWALELLPPAGSVIDLGTGSGAIALAIQSQRPDARVSAVDASADALAVAQANAQRLGLPVAFSAGNWLEGQVQRYDLIVSNPPYIAEADPHLAEGDVRFEPRSALTAGPDGLADLSCLMERARHHLHPAGQLLLEHGYQQAAAVRAKLTNSGWANVQSWPDLAGHLRVSGGTLSE